MLRLLIANGRHAPHRKRSRRNGLERHAALCLLACPGGIGRLALLFPVGGQPLSSLKVGLTHEILAAEDAMLRGENRETRGIPFGG